MSKHQKNSLKYIYKINSSKLVRCNWNLEIDVRTAKKNKEVISLSDSQAIEFIQDIIGLDYSESEVRRIKKEIKRIYNLPNSDINKDLLAVQYEKLDGYTFLDDCLEIIMDSKADFDRANKGFCVNGVNFKYLLATTNGGKNSTVIYVSEKVFPELDRRINNDRNPKVKIIPAKLEAYKSLVFSSSVTVPQPKGVIVVKDCFKDIVANVIKIDDTDKDKEPVLTRIENYPLHQNVTDGFGLITPEYADVWAKHLGLDYTPSGFQWRDSFGKGMLFVFDFHKFSRLPKVENKTVIDAWENPVDIIKEDIQIVLTTSMLKLWSSYESMEHYLTRCKENGYTFRVNKVTPKYLDDARDLNYQFIQPLLGLSEHDIDALIEPTVTDIKDIQGADYRKSLLYLSGENQTEGSFDKSENDCTKALKVDKRMINDPFVRNTIHKMIGKRINNAKMGDLRVRGNFSTVSGDPYILCQSMFGMKETTGLLKAGEFYSKYWNVKGVERVACFRAPMTSANNIRLLDLKNTEEMQEWYKYMSEITIFNAHDTTMNAMNGMDADGDAVFTTNFSPILNNVKELDTIICVQKPAEPKIVTARDLKKAVKNSFGDDIGKITNRVANMLNIIVKFLEDSEEYRVLDERIKCGQMFQQNSIDRSKGIKFKPMPKFLYDYKSNIPILEDSIKIKETKKGIVRVQILKDTEEVLRQKEFNMRILANKSPYFLIYRYPHRMSELKKFKREQDMCCLANFNCTVDELIDKKDKNDKETEFIKWYLIRNPVSSNHSTMNRICWKVEEIFEKRHRLTKTEVKELESFDYTMLMTDSGFDKDTYELVHEVYRQYIEEMKQYLQLIKTKGIDKEDSVKKSNIFRENFKRKATLQCPNMEMLTNIVVDMCYKYGDKSKQFAWDVCGERLIKNLLGKNNNMISYPVLDDNGDFEFKGKMYSMVTKQISEGEIEDEEDN